jgi:hypothetical protein
MRWGRLAAWAIATAGLLCALTLAGVSRGPVAAATASVVPKVGLLGPICRGQIGSARSPGDSGAPPRRDCCGECALCEPIMSKAVSVASRFIARVPNVVGAAAETSTPGTNLPTSSVSGVAGMPPVVDAANLPARQAPASSVLRSPEPCHGSMSPT